MIFGELNLSGSLLKALADLEFVNPTPIQEKAFPAVMSGKDVIGIAQLERVRLWHICFLF